MTTYVVRGGDTLTSIAQRYGTTVQELARENRIPNPNLISVGQKLQIPQRQDGQIQGQKDGHDGQAQGISQEQLLDIMPNLDEANAEEYLPYLNKAMAEFEINTKLRVAYFLATLAEESGQLMYWEEIWGPTEWQLTYEGREDLGNVNPGDGFRYKGHGPIQITGRHNHTIVGEALGVDAVNNPDVLCTPECGFRAAAYYVRHMSSWGDLNEYADAEDFESYTKGVNGGLTNYDSRVAYLNTALGVLPETIGVAQPVPEYKQVTLRVAQNTYLYREGTEEWARTPDLANAELATDGDGWVLAKNVPWKAPSTEPVATGGLKDRIKKVTDYNLALVKADIPYSWWYDGLLLNTDGPPAFGVDGPAPSPEHVNAVFCAGVGNLDLRLVGKPVPKNAGDSGYDGGTKAWIDTYGAVMVPFSLEDAEEGDVAFRPFQYSGPGDQGHWCYVGPNGTVIQSWAYPATVEPGVNADATLEQSHDGYYYIYLLKAKDWLGD